MSTEIKYKDIFGNELTIQQAQLSNDEYQIEQYVDGELKRVDYCYENNQIDSGTYYLSPDEDLQTVLNETQSAWRNGYFYINVHTVGSYTVRGWEVYEGSVKISKGQTVYDSQGREIAEQTLDVNTLSIIKTTKTYYLQTFGRFNNNDDILHFGIIDFRYNAPDLAPGEIRVIIHLSGYDHKAYYVNDQQNIFLNPDLAEVFSWDEQTYYQSAFPFIPS